MQVVTYSPPGWDAPEVSTPPRPPFMSPTKNARPLSSSQIQHLDLEEGFPACIFFPSPVMTYLNPSVFPSYTMSQL